MSDDQPAVDRFMFMRSFADAISDLDEKDQLPTFWAIVNYGLNGTEPPPGTARAILRGFQFMLNKSRAKVRAGNTGGGAGKGISRNTGNQNATKTEANENQTDSKTIANQKQNNSKTIANQYEGKGREEEEKRSEVKGSEVISTPKPPAKSKPRARAYKTVADIKGAHPKAMAFWEAVRAVYPSHRRHAPADYTLCQIEQDGLCERTDEIVAIVKRFVAEDDEWKRGFVPRMGNFFKDQLWQNDPTPPKPPEVHEIQKIYSSKPSIPQFEDTRDLPQ